MDLVGVSREVPSPQSMVITEVTVNREVKVRGGPMQGGFSKSLKADGNIDDSIERQTLKDKRNDNLNTQRNYSKGTKKKHEKTVQALVDQMSKYMDPFGPDVVRNFKIGVTLDREVGESLLHSTEGRLYW